MKDNRTFHDALVSFAERRVIKMKKVYPVIFTKTENEILIEVPDLEILSQGTDMINAIEMARDAIGLKGITLEDEGLELPNPSDLETIDLKASAFADDGTQTLSLVDVDFLEYRKQYDNRSVRRNVTLPNWLNQAAEKAHLNVSKVLQEALKEKLGIEKE